MRHLTRKWLISRNNKSREPFRRVLAHDGLKGIMNKLFSVGTIPSPAGSLSPSPEKLAAKVAETMMVANSRFDDTSDPFLSQFLASLLHFRSDWRVNKTLTTPGSSYDSAARFACLGPRG
jgi:hypothetical protein